MLRGAIARRHGKIVNIGGISGLRLQVPRGLLVLEVGAARAHAHGGPRGRPAQRQRLRAPPRHRGGGPHGSALPREGAKARDLAGGGVSGVRRRDALPRVTAACDIANALLFLVSDDSANMTGQSVTVDGGWDV